MNLFHTKRKKLSLFYVFFLLFYFAFGEVKPPCFLNNSFLERPQCVCEIRDFMKKVNKGLSPQDDNQNKVSNTWLFLGDDTMDRSHLVQDISREVGVELVLVTLHGAKTDFMQVVRAINQAQEITKQKKPVFLVINNVDKANGSTSNALRQHALRTQNNHYIMTILTAKKLFHFRKTNLGDDLLYYDKVYFPKLTFNERVLLLKKQNPELSDFQAKKLALLMRHFKVIRNNFNIEDIRQ